MEIFYFLQIGWKKVEIQIFSPWEKVGIFYFLATGSRKKLNFAVFSYWLNILLTWMIMQRLLRLKQISAHHFNTTCYNWILRCCHLKAGNLGECLIFSSEVVTNNLKFFIFVLSALREMFKFKFLAMTK